MNIAARPQAQIKGNECKSIAASVQEHKSKKIFSSGSTNKIPTVSFSIAAQPQAQIKEV